MKEVKTKDNSTATQAKIETLNKQIQVYFDNQKQLEANKKLVADLTQELFGDKNITVIDKYFSDNYIQHSPTVADGKEALKQAVSLWFKGAPKEKIDIHHLNAEGDLVYIHTKSIRGGVATASIEIFKVENGKVVEHWDVQQEVPEKSANPHPMF